MIPHSHEHAHYLVCCHPTKYSLTYAHFARWKLVLDKHLTSYIEDTLYEATQFSPVLTWNEIARRASFDPLVLHYQKRLVSAQHCVLFFPDWWGMPPALLTGWLQRVFAPGIAFDIDEQGDYQPRLDSLSLTLLISSDEKNESDLYTAYTRHFEKIVRYSGIAPFNISIFSSARLRGKNEARQWMSENIARFL